MVGCAHGAAGVREVVDLSIPDRGQGVKSVLFPRTRVRPDSPLTPYSGVRCEE